MGKKELSSRANWEKDGGEKALIAEQNLYFAFQKEFEGTDYVFHQKPKHLKNLYASVELLKEVLDEIYCPEINLEKTSWGVSPDFAIENTKTGKILFGEIKRQDGWIEGKEPSAGRGNAHERLCKLFTPGLIKAYEKYGKIVSDDFLPFWVVFQGDITRDPKRVREIKFWFDKYDKNYFMWRPKTSSDVLIKHFNLYIKKHLN